MTIPNVTPYTGDLPDLDDPTTFNSRMDSFASWFDGVVTEIAATVSGMNTALNDNGTVLDATADATQRVVNATEPTLSAGSGTAYTLTAASTITSYADGQSFLVRVHAASGASPTLNIDGLGALPIQIRDDAGVLAAIPDGLMRANELFLFTVAETQTVFEVTSQPIQEITDEIGMVPIITKTANNSTELDFTEFDDAIYKSYSFDISSIRPVTDISALFVRTSADGGSTFDSGASDYSYAYSTVTHETSPTAANAGDDAEAYGQITGTMGNGATEVVSGTLELKNPGSALPTHATFDLSYKNNSSVTTFVRGSVTRQASEAVDAIRFYQSAGNLFTGSITMYGLRKP